MAPPRLSYPFRKTSQVTKKTPQPSEERRRRVQSAEVGMGILKALCRLGGAASLTAVAAEVQESTAKVHRYMASLIQEGMVAQNPATQHYYLGQQAIAIGLAALRQCDPIRLGEPALVLSPVPTERCAVADFQVDHANRSALRWNSGRVASGSKECRSTRLRQTPGPCSRSG